MGLKTKIVVTKLSLKEPTRFNIMMSSLGVNILEGKEENYFFNCTFGSSPYRLTQMSLVGIQWMQN